MKGDIIMALVGGIIYVFLSAYFAKRLRILGIILTTVGAALLFSKAYAVMIFGIWHIVIYGIRQTYNCRGSII